MALTRNELIVLAEKIKNAEGDNEEENDAILDHFLANVSDPNAANYFFDVQYDELTAVEIVDKVLSYLPIQL